MQDAASGPAAPGDLSRLRGGGVFDGATVRSALNGEPIDVRHALAAIEQRAGIYELPAGALPR